MTIKLNWRRAVLIPWLTLVASNAFAQYIWAEDDKNNLFKIDTQTNQLSFVSTIWGAGLGNTASGTSASTIALEFTKQITDIAFVKGQLFGITPDSLFSINQSTGAATFIMGLANDAAPRPFTSLVYDPTANKLLAADDPKNNALGNVVPGQLFAIDLANKSITSLNQDPTGVGSCSSHKSVATCTPDANVAFRSSGDLAFVGSQLFLSSNYPTQDSLVTLVGGAGPAAGSISPVLTLSGVAVPQVWGMATDGNSLYGLAGQSLYAVNNSGEMTLLNTYLTGGVSKFNGATYLGTQAGLVPEPSTYALLLAGLGFVGFVARRRLPAAWR